VAGRSAPASSWAPASGGISGALVSRAKLQPFIATLAMMTFARGLAKYITGGQKISTT